jgi:hypothetical protein
MHRKRLYHQEFGVESDDDPDCFREHKRFLSEELSRRIAELKLNNNNSASTHVAQPPTNITPLKINREGSYNYVEPKQRIPSPPSISSPTNLSRAYRAQQKALMVYTPPTITQTDTKGNTTMLSQSPPQSLRTDVYEKIIFHSKNFIKLNKPSQEIVLYRDPKLLLKDAYESVNNPTAEIDSPMYSDQNMDSLTNGSPEQIPEIRIEEIDTESFQDEDVEMEQ